MLIFRRDSAPPCLGRHLAAPERASVTAPEEGNMVPIPSLLLPILLSAVVVFLLSALFHMILPIHRNDFKKVPKEDEVMEALRRLNIPPGDYMLPCARSMER